MHDEIKMYYTPSVSTLSNALYNADLRLDLRVSTAFIPHYSPETDRLMMYRAALAAKVLELSHVWCGSGWARNKDCTYGAVRSLPDLIVRYWTVS